MEHYYFDDNAKEGECALVYMERKHGRLHFERCGCQGTNDFKFLRYQVT